MTEIIPPQRKYFSVIIGEGCNAKCPFCIAPVKMKDSGEPLPIDLLQRASEYAQSQGATVASVSGGGEPLLLALRDPKRWEAMNRILRYYPKRDLHSNYSFATPADLFPSFSHLTVSLLPDPETNYNHMGYQRFEKTIACLRNKPKDVPLRLSATLGTDWVRDLSDIERYVDFARELGANSVTLRTLQLPKETTGHSWISDHYFDGELVEKWLGEKYLSHQASLRAMPIFDVEGVSVCCYHYARQTDTADEDFLYFRPHTKTGEYGLYTEYDDDNSQIHTY